MVKTIRLISLLFVIALAVILMNYIFMLPVILILTTFVLVMKYGIIQYNIAKKNYLSIGLRRFYLTGLIYQMITVIVFCVWFLVEYKSLIPFKINHLIIVAVYLSLIIFFDSKKNIFLISRNYIIHKHKFKITQWELSSLDKVYIYSDKVEFVKDLFKYKVAFNRNTDQVGDIYSFLKPLIKDKLVKKID